jgi:Ca2+:H+ antiporter
MDLLPTSGQNRSSIYHRLVPAGMAHGTQRRSQSLHCKPSSGINPEVDAHDGSQTPVPRSVDHSQVSTINTTPQKHNAQPHAPPFARRVSYAASSLPQPSNQSTSLPVSQSVDTPIKNDSSQQPVVTAEDFKHAVADVAVVGQRQVPTQSPTRVRASAGVTGSEAEGGTHGGHDAPSWSRTMSASVLLACTALYALIAGRSFFHLYEV